MKTVLKRFGIASIVTVISLLFPLIALEIYLRLNPSVVAWYVLPANIETRVRTDEFDTIVRTNAHGLREPRIYRKKKPGTFRIVMVGDSFTMGWGVNYQDTFEQVIQRTLRDEYQIKNVEVINMGQPAAQPPHYFHFVRDYAWWLEPDLIAIGFLLGNDSQVAMGPPNNLAMPPEDLYQAMRKMWWRDPNTVPIDSPNPKFRKELFPLELQQRLVYPAWEKVKLWWTRDRKQAPSAPSGYCEPHWTGKNYTFTREQVLQIWGKDSPQMKRYEMLARQGMLEKAARCEIMYYRINALIAGGQMDRTLGLDAAAEKHMQVVWRAAHDFLRDMRDLSTSFGADFAVLAIPLGVMVDKGVIKASQDLGQTEIGEHLYGTDRPSQALLDYCLKNNLTCFSYFTGIKEAASQERLYYPIDGHMTAKGNEILGKLMARDLANLIKRKRNENYAKK